MSADAFELQHRQQAGTLEELVATMAEAEGITLTEAAERIGRGLQYVTPPPVRIVVTLPEHHAVHSAQDSEGATVRMLRTATAVYVAPLGTPLPAVGEPLGDAWRDLGVLAEEHGVAPVTAAQAGLKGSRPNRATRRAAARQGRRRGR